MFEELGFETLTAPQAAVLFGLGLGALFGVLAQVTRFCFRRMIDGEDRPQAAAVWLTGLATAMIGTQWVVAQGWVDFAGHRFLAEGLPVLAIVTGGLMFGAGMILTRGCVSRLTVLTGSGNLRAGLMLVVFAVVAHATLKGVLAPLRVALGSVTVDVAPALPGGALLWSAAAVLAAAIVIWRARPSILMLVLAGLLGLLVPLGWAGTGFVLQDEFDPIALESLSFTAPWAEGLFWAIASSAVAPTFGTGLLGGVLAGALVAALLRGEFRWQSLEGPRQTGRYLSGAVLMGVGGVLAGGCTVGAGLAGLPTLSLAAALAVLSIAAGGVAMRAALNAGVFARGAAATTPSALPAE